MSSDCLIEFKDVHFSYGKRPLLRGVNMRIARGQLVAIMGGSGSGKTTLLRLISGQYLPQQGVVFIDGQDSAKMSAQALFLHRRRMGMLFQFGALFTDLNVFENVAFPLREHTTLSPAMLHDLVILKLNAVGLRGAQALMPAELSGGMARRVALARALALDPELILYDEPFTGLDPISLGVIAHLIKKLNEALGTSSVMVTHDVHTSLEIVDYIYFIAHGEIVASGSPDAVRNEPSPWVQQFIHARPDGPVQYAYTTSTTLEEDLGVKGGLC